MAKVIESEKGFKLIECNRTETTKFGGAGICDRCNGTPETGIYIAVLNSWYCPKCFEDWHTTARHYDEDKRIEEKNFTAYKDVLGIFARDTALEIIGIVEANIKTVNEKERILRGVGFVLATNPVEFCICENDKGINGTNVATYLAEPYVFPNRQTAEIHKERIKARNGNGEIKFVVWKAPDYWAAVRDDYDEMLRTLKENL